MSYNGAGGEYRAWRSLESKVLGEDIGLHSLFKMYLSEPRDSLWHISWLVPPISIPPQIPPHDSKLIMVILSPLLLVIATHGQNYTNISWWNISRSWILTGSNGALMAAGGHLRTRSRPHAEAKAKGSRAQRKRNLVLEDIFSLCKTIHFLAI